MLRNKVILLTGGADGIGWECAKAYARNGATLCVVDLKNIDNPQAKELPGTGHLFLTGNVSNEADIKKAFAYTIEKLGRIDAIHNNAAIAHIALPLHETSDDNWQLMMDVNLKSILYTTRYGLEYLKKTKGNILNTSSMVGSIGQDNHAAYVATKGAVNALTKAMALDYASMGIRVNAICPAAVQTPAIEKWSKQQSNHDQIKKYLSNLHPLGYLPNGDVIADAAVFLLSDAARFITGCILPVSGGAELGYRVIL
ncbi:MAG: SDR family oxidoreductase [Bacteroidetes bacterium]|nr:SDR family oxidoreductase [Bacteroidota bacterium]